MKTNLFEPDNSTVKLDNEIISRLSAFMSWKTVYGNNKQVIVIAPLCRANTDEVEFGTFHHRPPPCS